MNNKNIFLLCMMTTFIFSVFYIYINYSQNNSISSIICNEECKNIILISMIIMSIFTILYELERKDNISLLIMIFLLVGLYGVINIKEEKNIHYVFAGIVFISMIVFMVKHLFINNNLTNNNLLFIILLFQAVLLIITFINLNIHNNIFFLEVFYIVNFAVFYILLHFSTKNKIKSKKTKNKNKIKTQNVL